MRILVLQGSFRGENGITDIVLERFLEGVTNVHSDVEINVEYIVSKDIQSCKGCLRCWIKTPGVCSIKDDMSRIIELFNKSDIVIVATPMYVDGMSSYMKKAWERLLPVMSPYFEYGPDKVRHRIRNNGDKGLFLISTGAFPERKQFDSIVLSFERIAYNFKMKYLGQILRPESHSLTYCKKYGSKIIEVLNAIERCGEEFGDKLLISTQSLSRAEQPILESIDEFISVNNKMWDKAISKYSTDGCD